MRVVSRLLGALGRLRWVVVGGAISALGCRESPPAREARQAAEPTRAPGPSRQSAQPVAEREPGQLQAPNPPASAGPQQGHTALRSRENPCMLRSCEDAAYFVFPVAEGWPERTTLHACVEDRCDTIPVELAESTPAKFARGPAGFVFATHATHHCPPVLEEACGRTSLGNLLAQRSAGQRRLVVALALRSTGGTPRRVSVRLEREDGSAIGLPELPAELNFESGACRHPNGPRCEPKCCEVVYDLR